MIPCKVHVVIPHGMYEESTWTEWIPCGVHAACLWNGCGMNVESRWNPGGIWESERGGGWVGDLGEALYIYVCDVTM